jgi:hypothetical protein
MADNFKNEGWKAKSMKVLHKPNTSSSLETIWKHKVSETDPLLIKIGKKERGQFTHFRNACPPDAADEVLTWVLDNWAHYAYKVAGYKALQKVPTAPDLGFLLLYDNIAVSCWNLSKAPKKQEAKPAISVDNPVQSSSLASKHKTVSMDDLLADPED